MCESNSEENEKQPDRSKVISEVEHNHRNTATLAMQSHNVLYSIATPEKSSDLPETQS